MYASKYVHISNFFVKTVSFHSSTFFLNASGDSYSREILSCILHIRYVFHLHASIGFYSGFSFQKNPYNIQDKYEVFPLSMSHDKFLKWCFCEKF